MRAASSRRPWPTWRRRWRQGDRVRHVVKAGRTHLMDAVPVTLGQEFAGYARAGRARRRRAGSHAAQAPPSCRWAGRRPAPASTPHRGSPRRSSRRSARRPASVPRGRRPLRGAGRQDALVELSGALKVVAVSLTKICNDLRWMGSGPAHRARRDPPARPPAGLEHHAGQGQPGRPRGDADGVRPGHRQRRDDHPGRRRGAFELNVMLPVMARNLLESIDLLATPPGCWPTGASTASRPTWSAAATWPRGRRRSSPRSTGTSATRPPPRSPRSRSRSAARSATWSSTRGHVERGELTEAQLDEALDVLAMARPPR